VEVLGLGTVVEFDWKVLSFKIEMERRDREERVKKEEGLEDKLDRVEVEGSTTVKVKI